MEKSAKGEMAVKRMELDALRNTKCIAGYS